MQVKVCDMKSDTFKEDFINSLINTGFAVLTNHDISFDLIKEAQEEWKIFFTSNQSSKEEFINHNNPNMGYKKFRSEKAIGSALPDLKAFFHWKPGESIPSNILGCSWELFIDLDILGLQLLDIIDEKDDTSYKQMCIDSDNTILRTIYYPPLKTFEGDGVRAEAHEDINFITLLIAATASGLQVMDKDCQWHDVPYQENSIIVNIGDMLQLASNGKYKSTTHRVINPKDKYLDRISMPLFVHPKSNVMLADNITAKQFLNQRLNDIYISTK